ncbi:MAG: hypothetical protein JST06_11460 [Bacteroidetes bacterium]|nr:hypothetical protein [Bacteroidota bacterium]MBS1630426.1 hypothetical protein [Bacteroidota bacterium]
MSSQHQNRNKVWRRFQAGRHIVMGLILMALAYALVRFRSFGAIELSATSAYTLGAILVVYGLFRIWRGGLELRKKDSDDFIT